jgi:hypothetical protein
MPSQVIPRNKGVIGEAEAEAEVDEVADNDSKGRSWGFNNATQKNDFCSNVKVINYPISSGHTMLSSMKYCVQSVCHTIFEGTIISPVEYHT